MNRTEKPAGGIAAEFVEALAHRDFEIVESLLSPDVRFRALVPSGVKEASDRTGAADWLRMWFGQSDEFVVERSGVEQVGGRHRVWYRFHLDRDCRPCTIDQEGFIDVGGGCVTDVSLVCSGFRPAVRAMSPDPARG